MIDLQLFAGVHRRAAGWLLNDNFMRNYLLNQSFNYYFLLNNHFSHYFYHDFRGDFVRYKNFLINDDLFFYLNRHLYNYLANLVF